jgi:acetoin utilization deacetylase AcuC-like enzyme
VKTGLITSDTYQNHNTGEGHPEKIDRVTAVIDNFKKIDNKELIWKKPAKFDQSFLVNTHSSKYIDLVNKSFPENGLAFLDGDTVVSPGSKEATKDAVGSIITAIDGVEKKEFKNAFCAVRPPGHHAEKDKAMGFCIYNNVAVGANYLIQKYNYSKVAIIDFDVHHGNGTQDIFYDNEKVLYISTHQYPYYPGSGSEKEN